MKVLIGCEYSGVVRDSFAKRGHLAISCDLLPSDSPDGYHYQGDIHEMLKQEWDLVIVHPPCTALAVSGNKWYGTGMPKHDERIASVEWTVDLWERCKAAAPMVCLENPVGVLTTMGLMPAPQYVQPYEYGHTEQKKTGLFLHNLPDLVPTNNVYVEMMKLPKRKRERLHYLPPSEDRWKIRSTTYQGIADAMADQWGTLLDTEA